jgi:signal transduction histidine kinase
MFETPYVNRSGKVRWSRWRVARLAKKGGTFDFGGDVTEELGKREQREQLARLDAAGTLVAGLAHALRNPLNGAGLHLALAERAAVKAQADDAVDAVRVATKELRRLSGLVSEFLEFARPNPIVRSGLDLRAVCASVVESARPLAAARNIALTSDLPTQPLQVDADAEKMEHILAHLVENAIEAARARVVLRARRLPHDAMIEIEDDGTGFATEGAPIFDAFYSTKPDGTGLGLAIVQRVIAEHGGDIDVERLAGSTCFRLRLPFKGEDTKS